MPIKEIAKGLGKILGSITGTNKSFEATPISAEGKRKEWMLKRQKIAQNNPSIFGQAINNGYIPFGGGRTGGFR